MVSLETNRQDGNEADRGRCHLFCDRMDTASVPRCSGVRGENEYEIQQRMKINATKFNSQVSLSVAVDGSHN